MKPILLLASWTGSFYHGFLNCPKICAQSTDLNFTIFNDDVLCLTPIMLIKKISISALC